ncbi:hypothetical protein GPX89_25050 [Nocardia sp. ET3-3]|uniref:Uncharacterized protein n=1 Tax=Nocardia terrae TaxID=2675851 RepID=A0A7K1V1N9_9NOCA|nr:hypothetical protein [Nocardia terrae]MVU80504.1 hypothetical protein [Nocardia terrae]
MERRDRFAARGTMMLDRIAEIDGALPPPSSRQVLDRAPRAGAAQHEGTLECVRDGEVT